MFYAQSAARQTYLTQTVDRSLFLGAFVTYRPIERRSDRSLEERPVHPGIKNEKTTSAEGLLAMNSHEKNKAKESGSVIRNH